MLSSSPSLLLPTVQTPLAAGDAISPAGGDPAPGFAELLNGLAAKASEGDMAVESDIARGTAGDAPPLARVKVLTARAGRPAIAAEAAIESGKILPAGLPETAGDDREAGAAGAEPGAAVAGAGAPPPLPLAPAALPLQAPTDTVEPDHAAAPSSRRMAAVARQAPAHPANPVAGQPTDKSRPDGQKAQGQSAPAVAITVASQAQAISQEAVAAAAAEPAEPARPKPARAADLLRIEAPLAQVSPSAAQFAQADQPAPVKAPAPNMPASTPSPNDISAALDHLAAAREALMPAEAALAIDHAEFGEISIRLEQSSDGRLSAELAGADPELQRAVTAAVAADRGQTASDGDSGRSAQLASQRSTNTGGGDTARGERGQSGTDREPPQRQSPARSQARQAATDQRPGVFA